MDSPPTSLHRQLTRQAYVDELIRDEMYVQPVLLMQFEHPKTLQIGPIPKQKSQKVIPTLARFLHGQQLLERKGPQEQPVFSERLRRKQEGAQCANQKPIVGNRHQHRSRCLSLPRA